MKTGTQGGHESMEADTAMLCALGTWREAWKTLPVSRGTEAHDL